MKIKEGTSRIVFVGDSHVVKVAKINMDDIKGVQRFARKLLDDEHREGAWEVLTGPEGATCSIRSVIRGIMENIREAKVSRDLPELVVPTRLSIAGVFNVQDLAATLPPCITTSADILRKFFYIFREELNITRDELPTCAHTLRNMNNFGLHDGQVKFVDYGSSRLIPDLYKNPTGFKHALQRMTEMVNEHVD